MNLQRNLHHTKHSVFVINSLQKWTGELENRLKIETKNLKWNSNAYFYNFSVWL